MTELNEKQRAEILDAVSKTVVKRFYDPQLRGVDWDAAVAIHRSDIVTASSAEAFESAISKLLGELKTSHMGFYHHALERATSKMAISATYAAFPVDGNECWIFQDVHPGGAAYLAGIRSGDILVSVGGRSFAPPEHPVFPMGQKVELKVITSSHQAEVRLVDVPPPTRKRNQLPYAQPKLVTGKRLSADTGYIRISMYPGMIGIEVANEISSKVGSLGSIERLILDLRGNTGGGIGVLRAMSFLTPERIPVGYSLTRRQLETADRTDQALVFDRIPAKKHDLLPMLFKFLVFPWLLKLAGQKKFITLATEGIGHQSFHGRIVLLINRHTASANEMLVAFAKENHLATIVGEATPGRLLAGSKFKLPYDYWLALPVGVYRTASGTLLEGTPIVPDIEVSFDPGQAREGRDTQLEKAIEIVSQL
jgi:C-terminal processing protease CtpA/Prc